MGWPKSLRWRYSLRALFVFITLFMIWGGYHANRGWRQRAAEEILRKHGAVFGYGDAMSLRTPIPGETKIGYLRRWVGKKYEETVHSLWGDCYIKSLSVSIEDPEVGDAVEMLPQIERLWISSRRKISSEEQLQLFKPGALQFCREAPRGALARMLANKKIKNLEINLLDLSDEDCRTIAQERSIERIALWHCKLSGDSFAALLRRPGLHELSIFGCEVAEPALASLPPAMSLEVAHCRLSNVDLEFASYLARCPNLRTLWVQGTTDGHEFLARLGPHPSLNYLVLNGPISDQAVDYLIEMPSLRRLAVSRNALSREAEDRLKNAKPELKM